MIQALRTGCCRCKESKTLAPLLPACGERVGVRGSPNRT